MHLDEALLVTQDAARGPQVWRFRFEYDLTGGVRRLHENLREPVERGAAGALTLTAPVAFLGSLGIKH
jgi:hypothetical protein